MFLWLCIFLSRMVAYTLHRGLHGLCCLLQHEISKLQALKLQHASHYKVPYRLYGIKRQELQLSTAVQVPGVMEQACHSVQARSLS